jgi:hypothetical protein
MTGTEISLLLQIPIVGIFVFFVLKLYELQRKTIADMTQTYSETIDRIVKRLAEESTNRDETMRGYITEQRQQDRGMQEQTIEMLRFFREELQANNLAIQNNTSAIRDIKTPPTKGRRQ